MAQMKVKDYDVREEVKRRERSSNSCGPFKLNVAAPEFVPTLAAPAISGYFYPCFQPIDGSSNGSWIYVAADQEVGIPFVPNDKNERHSTEILLSEEIKRKIIKQAEYMFSDMSMLANETLVKHVNKDPQGYVPINFVSTLKKLKSLDISNHTVAEALRSSSKLIVSSDGKKVKRRSPFTEKEKEELQVRTVIAENLPDDHSHQKIEKMFNVVGSIKSIRICQPQEHNASRSNKADVVVSHKLHALVEYENAEMAEKAAEKLNDEGNWRKGMRVRLMLKRSPKPVVKSRRLENFDAGSEDNGPTHLSPEYSSLYNTSETESDDNSKKTWSRNRAKSMQRALQGTRSLPAPSSHSIGSCPGQQPVKGPRMPDGTRGFTMGRGKPLLVSVRLS